MATSVDEKIQALLSKNAETSVSWPKFPTMKEFQVIAKETGGAVAVCTKTSPYFTSDDLANKRTDKIHT